MIQFKVFAVLFAVLAAAQAVKVPITVYYESLCPDSAKFITEQIYPAVKGELKDYVDIKWVPFGKSQYTTQSSDVMFVCHHGPNECYGNKVHACAIEHIQANSYQIEFTRESLTLDFINCMMKAGVSFQDNVFSGSKCARDNNIYTWEPIQQCTNTTEGSQLLKMHGDTTNKFQMPLESVPAIVFKEQYDKKVNDRAMVDFRATVCDFISQPKPRVCTAFNSAVAAGSATFAIAMPIIYSVLRMF